MQNKDVRLEHLLPLIQESLSRGQSVKFFPRGISMLPMLRQGKDSVLISPLPDRLKKYDLPLYRRDDGKFVLHRIVKAGETYTCVGDNQYWLERGVEHRLMIGLVTEFYRDGRRIRVDDPRYQLYCRIWHYSRPLRHVWFAGTRRCRAMIKRLRKGC